jgi:ABC-2 type transport system ATP-binding protein
MIEVESLTHRYGRTLAVDGLSLSIAPGEVHGLLGHNGAGKSTTIRCLLGLQKPRQGRTRVFGLDSWKHGVEIRRRAGYVPEDLQFYPWMTVAETLRFVSAFHPTWDAALADDMARRLELPLRSRMKELSRGMSAKVALLCATAFHPEALILDDPTSGLDALVRREFLEQVIAVAAEGGRAVLFSSHVLDEVERIADVVSIVVAGRKVFERRMDDLKATLRRVRLTFPGDVPAELPASIRAERDGRTATLVVDGWGDESEARVRALGATSVSVEELSLEDAFVAVVQAAKASR